MTQQSTYHKGSKNYGTGYEMMARIDAQAAMIKALVEALVLADNNLTNLQPKIGNGLVHKDWVPVFDSYIDPVISAARAAIAAAKETPHE